MSITMKKTMRALTILFLTVLLINTIAPIVFAASDTPLDPTKITADYGSIDEKSDIVAKAGKIMGMIRNVSVIAAVIILMVLGVKYMLGSVEEKAEYKKSFVPLVVGIVLVVSATAIASFIFNMVG